MLYTQYKVTEELSYAELHTFPASSLEHPHFLPKEEGKKTPPKNNNNHTHMKTMSDALQWEGILEAYKEQKYVLFSFGLCLFLEWVLFQAPVNTYIM